MKTAPRPVIVVANHVSHLDTPVILRALPARIRRRLIVAAAKDYFYRTRIRSSLVSLSMASIPFDRGEASRESLAECGRFLLGGWSVLLFPEGTRSPTGALGRVRRGAAALAHETGTPVLPLYIHGLSDVMPKGSVAPLPGGVVLLVGRIIPPGGDVEATRDRIQEEMDRLASERPGWGASAAGEA
jgi:1-acyl-sn-glycerol-3-phosphate acyltransferase